MDRMPNLSKSRFQAGLQCHKRLWLECYRREVADPLGPERLALFDAGHRFGEVARQQYAGGELVAEDFRHSYAAQQTTTRLLDEGASCLYEAALLHDGVLVRVDIVRKVEGAASREAWQLIEVKSSTQLKPEHITDAAIQTYVARGAGLPVSQVTLLHLAPGRSIPDEVTSTDGDDTDEAAIDQADLFIEEDITARVEEYLLRIPALLAGMKAMLGSECPEMEVGEHCSQPYDCFFWGHCHGASAEMPAR